MPGDAPEPSTFRVTDQPSPDDVRIIEQALMAFNVERARPYDRRPLHVFVSGESGETLGGLTGFTNWEWLYVDCLWLPEDRRGSRLGARLLEIAEDEARRRGCRHAHLYSYSFQAPDFYRKQGYAIYATLEGYPPGETRVLLRKNL
jgi:GNAT superfamily N-acetyltransferase